MVSFQPAALLSPGPLPDYSSKKRKSEDLSLPSDHHHHHHHKSESFFQKRSKPESGTSMGVQLETSPLPFEWQRCLDIQSGELHLYNVKTEKKTFDEPRMRSPRSPVGGHMSLELQLNLPCDSDHDQAIPTKHNLKLVSPSDQQRSFPSWLAVEEEEEEEQQQEMMATVCMKCHMLVMLCKASPACPNCKFMHPVDQPPANLFKPSCLTLLC